MCINEYESEILLKIQENLKTFERARSMHQLGGLLFVSVVLSKALLEIPCMLEGQ